MVIPGRLNSKHLIDVYLKSLIEELQDLWHMGVLMRNSAKNDTFMMRAALMWIVYDLPTYVMASGWRTVGVMGCPVYMEDTRAFYLQNDRKACYFDCHRQLLPLDHPIRIGDLEANGIGLHQLDCFKVEIRESIGWTKYRARRSRAQATRELAGLPTSFLGASSPGRELACSQTASSQGASSSRPQAGPGRRLRARRSRARQSADSWRQNY
ncbi:UNVERIFIED_CONTAM: hypothetical protein Sradi_3024000 [Sesamum radiatum]|uniref:Uncharacterized protein n=1 Tax=Sesamum radiatum TaxID=300843 RepID=A0AAW2S1L4_SESRA